MPILSRTGRRSLQHRLILAAMYAVLIAGSVAMIYPLLLMVAGSSKSAVDRSESAVLPGFIASKQRLYAKYVEGLFNEDVELMSQTYGVSAYGFNDLELPTGKDERLTLAWAKFVDKGGVPAFMFERGLIATPGSRGSQPAVLRGFKDYLRQRFGDDITRVNANLKTDFRSWNDVYVLPSDRRLRQSAADRDAAAEAFAQFARSRPASEQYALTLTSLYRTGFLKARYSGDLNRFNREHSTAYPTWRNVPLSRTMPADARGREEWEEFVRYVVHPNWLIPLPPADAGFSQSLKARFASIDALNAARRTAFKSFEEIRLAEVIKPGSALVDDWYQFAQGWTDAAGRPHRLPIELVRLDSPEFRFQDELLAAHGSLAAINAAMGTSYQSISDIQPPQQRWHYDAFVANTGALRWELLTRNFRTVIEYLLLNGRGAWNTLVYCVLSVAASLVINPLAAYGLSRYRPRSTYTLLLIVMLTMAFPPMVTQIPSFLMIRDLHLLNTFAALILPGLANGYSIFLLKGFFDSLPQELYESASLDGAGEFRIFWQITMSLSTPILAVIALNAFMLAYANFMFALLVCQDPEMWTISVWLYHLQTRSGQGVVYASLLLAAIPTLVVFLCCQNVIMRGIVVPVEK